MRIKLRKAVLIGLVAIILLTAGCSQASNSASPTATATDTDTPTPTATPTPTEYHAEASDYLLDITDFDNRFTVNTTREANFDPVGTESSRAIEVYDRNEEDYLTVVVIVMDSQESADSFLDDQRTTYETRDLTIVNESVGDRSFTVGSGRYTYLDARKSNVYIQVYGTLSLNEIKGITNDQIDEITD